jgi:AcrR family transcriptional regulator
MSTTEDKRTLILDAALGVIREEGLSAFTQPKVAKRAGLRQSHLTYYFPTRDDLLVAVAGRVVDDRVAGLEAVAAARTPTSKVGVLARILTDPEQTRLLLALIQTVEVIPEVAVAFDRLRERLVPGSASLLDSWKAEASPESLQLLQATSTGIAVLALANGGSAFRRSAELLLTRLLTDLGGPDPRNQR